MRPGDKVLDAVDLDDVSTFLKGNLDWEMRQERQLRKDDLK